MRVWNRRLPVLASAVGFAALSLSAAPISGTVNISGSVAVGETFIDFQPPVGPPNGAFVVSNTGNTGSFAGLSNTTGLILDLNDAVEPPGQSFPTLKGFVTFAAAPNISLDLTEIDPGAFSSANCFASPAAGQTCTPAATGNGFASPFNLTNTSATTSTAAITVRGNAVNTATGESSPFIGIFTTQFTVPYQTLLAEVTTGQVATSYSTTFAATTVPEPMTPILLGSGLIALGALRRFRRK